ncbi:hypothetical protein ABKN59_000144 [Abortiporus biennis]
MLSNFNDDQDSLLNDLWVTQPMTLVDWWRVTSKRRFKALRISLKTSYRLSLQGWGTCENNTKPADEKHTSASKVHHVQFAKLLHVRAIQLQLISVDTVMIPVSWSRSVHFCSEQAMYSRYPSDSSLLIRASSQSMKARFNPLQQITATQPCKSDRVPPSP